MEWYDKALEALADFNRAVELDPDYVWAFASRGDTYRQMKQYDQALADLNQAVELNPGEYWAIGRRGRTYWEMGRYGKALAAIKCVFKLVLSDTPPEI
jgi:tetratricopeptide (TPR) repeat protein